MAVNDVAQVRVIGSFLGQQLNVVLHFRFKSAGAGLTALLAELEATTTTFRDMFTASGSTVASYTELQGQMLIPYGAASQALAISPVWAGADASQPMPPQAAMVATKRTDLIGRSRRGRIYWGGFGVNAQAGTGLWTTTAVAARQTAMNNMGAVYGEGGSSADYEMGVWSRTLAGPTPPFSFAAYQALDSVIVRPTIRTQRRRQVGVGS